MSIYRLKGTAGAVANQAFQLSGRLLIGRADDCDIRIDEASVAPHQLEISLLEEGGVNLRTLASSDSVLLNGEPVTEAAMAGGDEIRVGSCRLMLQAPGLRPDRVLTGEAIRPRRKVWPWILLAVAGAAGVFAWRQGMLAEWIALISGAAGG